MPVRCVRGASGMRVSADVCQRDACQWDHAYQWDEKSTSVGCEMRASVGYCTCERRDACDACEWDACQSYAYSTVPLWLRLCVCLESAHRWVSVVCACVAFPNETIVVSCSLFSAGFYTTF